MRFSFCLLLLLSFCGCSDDGLTRVSGNVSLEGKPLPDGYIFFTGEDGIAIATGIIKNGAYQLMQSASMEGILPGEYLVRIDSWIVEPMAVQADGSFAKGESRIPKKYNSSATSELTAAIPEKTRKITFDFDLKSN